jgi:hypothetical protein
MLSIYTCSWAKFSLRWRIVNFRRSGALRPRPTSKGGTTYNTSVRWCAGRRRRFVEVVIFAGQGKRYVFKWSNRVDFFFFVVLRALSG